MMVKMATMMTIYKSRHFTCLYKGFVIFFSHNFFKTVNSTSYSAAKYVEIRPQIRDICDLGIEFLKWGGDRIRTILGEIVT